MAGRSRRPPPAAQLRAGALLGADHAHARRAPPARRRLHLRLVVVCSAGGAQRVSTQAHAGAPVAAGSAAGKRARLDAPISGIPETLRPPSHPSTPPPPDTTIVPPVCCECAPARPRLLPPPAGAGGWRPRLRGCAAWATTSRSSSSMASSSSSSDGGEDSGERGEKGEGAGREGLAAGREPRRAGSARNLVLLRPGRRPAPPPKPLPPPHPRPPLLLAPLRSCPPLTRLDAIL